MKKRFRVSPVQTINPIYLKLIHYNFVVSIATVEHIAECQNLFVALEIHDESCKYINMNETKNNIEILNKDF